MAILCALYRRAGRADPITAVKCSADLPAYLGLPPSVTLEALQRSPHWAMRAILNQVEQYPVARAARRRLYRYLASIYRDRNHFPNREFYWRYYVFCRLAAFCRLAERILRAHPSRSH